MFAYSRTWLEYANAEYMNSDDLHLENYPVNKEPPPLLDNLFNPSLLEVLPGTFFNVLYLYISKHILIMG